MVARLRASPFEAFEGKRKVFRLGRGPVCPSSLKMTDAEE